MTVGYSKLEMMLLSLLSGLIGNDYDTGAIIGAQLPFNRLLDAIIALLRHRLGADPDLRKIIKFLGRAKNAVDRRNSVVHSAWFGQNAEELHRLKITATAKRGLEHHFVKTSPKDVDSIVNELNSITEEMLYLVSSLEEKGVIPSLTIKFT